MCVIDGRGGGFGSRLVEGLRSELGPDHHIVALGTNNVAASAMKQAGAAQVGVGPRAIIGTLRARKSADVLGRPGLVFLVDR